MMYHAWMRPGMYPSMRSAKLITESAVHIPFLIQTIAQQVSLVF